MAYSDGEIAEALVRLAVNKYNFQETADQINVPVQTLRRWNKNVPKKGVAELLERAISRLLMAIPQNMSGHDWAVAMGILLDKWLLVEGKPNTRTETIFTALQEMPDDELDALIREFEEAANSIAASKNGKGET